MFLHVLAMRELPEAQVEHSYPSSLRVFGFYQPVSSWPLPATVTGLLSSLIHLLSSPQSSGCPSGWPRTEFPSLQLPCTFEALGRTWAGAWCRTGRLWVPLTPRQWWLRLWMTRRPQTRGTVNAAPSPRRLRCRLLRRHWLGRRITRDRGSSSTPSWLTGVPQAGSMDSLMSGSCTPRSPKFSTSPPQRYETIPEGSY